MSDTGGIVTHVVGSAWESPSVVASYRHRPEYPPETFQILAGLINDEPAAVLDLGCGTGFIARPLAPYVHRIDAVDASAAMIEEARRLQGGDDPVIRWLVGHAEDAPLDPPYALVTLSDSLHWMRWDVVLPRLAGALSPNGRLAILSVDGTLVTDDATLERAIEDAVERYATYWRIRGNLVGELEKRGLFKEEGRIQTEPVPLIQTVDEYVESFHARAGLSWDRMTPDDAAAFDAALRQLVMDRVGDTVEQAVKAFIGWGRPLRP